MLRDMTIGQYYPVKSKIHELDPRVKLVAVFVYLISLFTFDGFAGYLVVLFFLCMTVMLSHVPLSYMCKGLRSILFLMIFTGIFHFFQGTGDVIFQWKFITVTVQGIQRGVFMILRLLFLVLGSSLLTYTTTPNKLTDGIESLLKPLKRVKVPVHDLAMMMSLALRFIPILVEEANRIIRAQSARGADFDEGKLVKRLSAMVSILVPLLVSSTRRAYDLALAMEARCYQGDRNRTKMKPLKFQQMDGTAVGVMVGYVVLLWAADRFLPF